MILLYDIDWFFFLCVCVCKNLYFNIFTRDYCNQVEKSDTWCMLWLVYQLID